MSSLRNAIAAGVATILVALPVSGQSLVDIAKREEARRNTVKAPSKTYTNSSLKPDLDATAAAETKVAPPTVMVAAAASAAPANATPPAPADPTAKAQLNEAYWRRSAVDFRARVEKARAEVAKVIGHTHPDPREQARIDKLLREAQGKLASYEAALQQFEKQAKAEGVPPAWIR